MIRTLFVGVLSGVLATLMACSDAQRDSGGNRTGERSRSSQPAATAPALASQITGKIPPKANAQGTLGGALQLAPDRAAIYAVEFSRGQATLLAAAILQGEPGWQTRTATAGSPLRELSHVGIGATLGSHSLVFDPSAEQLWIDDNLSQPMAAHNVIVFEVPADAGQPLEMVDQKRIDPDLGSIPIQGFNQLIKERVRGKLAEFALVDRR